MRALVVGVLLFASTAWAQWPWSAWSGTNGQCLVNTAGTVTWGACGGAAGAPTDATYWTGSANSTLSAEHNLGALGTGLVLNTSGTPSAYAGTSCTNQFPRSLSASGVATCAGVGIADLTASGTPSSSTFLRGDNTWATPSGGADPWTYLSVNGGSDFSTTSGAAVDVTGLAFTPSANTKYEFECKLLLRTATTTVNPRVGLAWSTGLTDGVCLITEAQAATGTPLFASGNPNAALLIAVGGLPNTTQSWPATVTATIAAGASPSGTTRVQLASETAGTSVTVKSVGSFCRYRSFT